VGPRILLLNGALGGRTGNPAHVLERLAGLFAPADVRIHHLAEDPAAIPLVAEADAVVLATGTYWDSWGSPLQRFLEEATPTEGTAVWLGKPVAVLVTEHAVGGKGVLSRLKGVMSTFGALVPPMSGLVLSRMAHESGFADAWCMADLEVIAHNLLEAVRGGRSWRTWPVDRTDPHTRWL
jgi:chromate reductase